MLARPPCGDAHVVDRMIQLIERPIEVAADLDLAHGLDRGVPNLTHCFDQIAVRHWSRSSTLNLTAASIRPTALDAYNPLTSVWCNEHTGAQHTPL